MHAQSVGLQNGEESHKLGVGRQAGRQAAAHCGCEIISKEIWVVEESHRKSILFYSIQFATEI